MLSRMTLVRRLALTVHAMVLGVVFATTAVADTSPTYRHVAASDLSVLADSGQFDALLTILRQDYSHNASEPVNALITDIERYRRNRAARDEQRQEEYEKQLSKVRQYIETGTFRIEPSQEELAAAAEQDAEQTDEAEQTEPREPEVRWGRLEDALVAAINAHGLAQDVDAFFAEASVRELIARAEREAAAAETRKEWVDAMTLHRLLEMLDEPNIQYKEAVNRVARHMRVLQLYAPEKLEQMYQQRAERRGDEYQPLNIDPEPWSERLKHIRITMLRQTLMQAARKHIDAGGFLPLVIGGVQNLRVLIGTDGLEQVFPELTDEKKRKQFRDYLHRIMDMLEAPGAELDFLDAAQVIDRMVAMNDVTIDLPEEVIVYEMTEGATGTLDDFSSVIWPEDLEQFSRSTEGKFYGVGIQISRRDEQLLVVSPLVDTPAQSAGIKAGDIIVSVDGQATATWGLDKAVREITGPKDTVVTLGIQRKGHAEPLEFEIKRDEIKIDSIRGWVLEHAEPGEDPWNYWIDPAQRIGYIRVTQFIPQTADDLDRAIEKMQADGPINGLILDLRGNPGGLLKSAVQIADRFVEEGPLVYTVDAAGRRELTEQAHRHNTYPQFPVTVLIDDGAASASEIVAGALQDYGRGLIVGTRSFGKGSVQDLFRLGKGLAYLKLTTQYYQLPLGRIIHRKPGATDWGIEPDLQVPMTEQQRMDARELRQEADIVRDEPMADGEEMPRADDLIEQGLDAQLETALLVLKTHQLASNLAIAQADTNPNKPASVESR